MDIEARRAQLEADKAAFEEEERLRHELESRLTRLKSQREELARKQAVQTTLNEERSGSPTLAGAFGEAGPRQRPVSRVAGCDFELHEAFIRAFGDGQGTALAMHFAKEEVGLLEYATVMSQSDVKDVLITGNFDVASTPIVYDAIQEAMKASQGDTPWLTTGGGVRPSAASKGPPRACGIPGLGGLAKKLTCFGGGARAPP